MLRTKILPVIAGFISASIVMVLFEYANSFVFPFPEGFDTANLEMLRQFTEMYSPHIFILVWCGWFFGSGVAGYVTTKLSNETQYRLSAVVGVFLTLAGIANHLMLNHPLWFNIIGLPVFIMCTYGGHKLYLRCKVTTS